MADDDGFIDIVHEETHGTARVVPDALDLVWKALGWKKASEQKVEQEQAKSERATARREG